MSMSPFHVCAGLGNQCCDVVLVKGALTWEKPQGVRVSEWETDGEQMGSRLGGMEMKRSVFRATWDQGGRILSQQGGFQVSKGDQEREQKGNQQGETKSKGKAQIYS
jgi:hypothetical protein